VKDEETTKLELAIDMGKLEKLKSKPVTVIVEETTKLELAIDIGKVEKLKSQPVTVKVEETTTKLEFTLDLAKLQKEPAGDSER
jgi:preprotein translocase subunit YajC